MNQVLGGAVMRSLWLHNCLRGTTVALKTLTKLTTSLVECNKRCQIQQPLSPY
jgi:hypothetical protein